MTTKITRDIIESSLNCKYEGYLKLVGQQGIQCDYGVLLAASRDAVSRLALDKISARHSGQEVERDFALTMPHLKRGAAFYLNATLEDEQIALAFDGLKRVPGPSKLGDFQYVPVLFCESRQIRKQQRALLEVYGPLALSFSRLLNMQYTRANRS